MVELRISNNRRKKYLDEEKLILQAAGSAKGGDKSAGELIANLVAEKHEEGKNDPDQFNAPYAYAKCRHMLDRYNFLLRLSDSEKDLEEELKRTYRLDTIKPMALMARYFAIPDSSGRFSWAGSLACVESTLMYDTMQIILLHPGASLEQYNQKLADPSIGRLLAGLESTYNAQEPAPKASNEQGPRRQESKSAGSSGGGCMLVLVGIAFVLYVASALVH